MLRARHWLYVFRTERWATICFLLLASPTIWALEVRREIAPREPQVGQPCQLTLIAEGEKAAEFTVVDSYLRDGTTTWTRTAKPPVSEVSKDGRILRVSYEIVPLRPGLQPLPPVPIRMSGGKIEVFPLKPVEIRSHFAQDEITTFPFGVRLAELEEKLIPPGWVKTFPRLLAVLALLIIAVVAAAVGMLVRRKSSAPAPALPPDLRALLELEKLESEGLVAKRQFKEFYSRLSDTVRSFVGTIWGFDGLECTTAELLREVENKPLPLALQREIEDVLEEADLVKFAKYQPEPMVCEKALNRARNIIRGISALIPRERPVSNEKGGGRP